MQEENKQDSRAGVTGPRYMLLSLLSIALFALGLLGHFFPEVLSPLGGEISGTIEAHWLSLLVGAVVIGLVNVLLTLFTSRKS